MTVKVNTGDIQSKQKFQNVFVYLEYVTPYLIANNDPHGRGNSGVLLNGSCELQILDVASSYDLDPTLGCGAVYGIRAPLEVACHEQEVWNTYEIEFQATTCDPEYPSIVVTPARFVEVKLNGTLFPPFCSAYQQQR
jgi:hypothetical protein